MNVNRSLINHSFIQVNKDNVCYYGGDQDWWNDSNRIIAEYGCGIIAMCDLELYLSKKYKDKSADERTYINYINERAKHAYRISKLPFIKKLGLFPWKMTRGIRGYLKQKLGIKAKVIWAPSNNADKVFQMIIYMLDNDIPVVASYDCTLKGEALNYYKKNADGRMKKISHMRSHYFVMTGIDDNIIQISTYGEKYYVFFSDWVKNISYFTNILYIKNKAGI